MTLFMIRRSNGVQDARFVPTVRKNAKGRTSSFTNISAKLSLIRA